MIVIPAIDIKNGKCVRLYQGKYDREEIFLDDPIYAAKQWESQGAEIIHIIDLDGAREGKRKNNDIIEKIVETVGIPIQLGGGIRTYEDAKYLLDNGVERIILGTISVNNLELVKKLLDEFGADRIIVAVDSRGEKVFVKGWLKGTSLNCYEFSKRIETLGIKIILFTSIEKDGTLKGPNFEAIGKMVRTVDISILVAGGVCSLEDLQRLSEIGVEGVVIGKALYKNCFTLKEAIECTKK